MTKAPTTATLGACCARARNGQTNEGTAAAEQRDELPPRYESDFPHLSHREP